MIPRRSTLVTQRASFALFETGNGWQHGVIEILVALLAAFMFVPLRPLLPRSRDRR